MIDKKARYPGDSAVVSYRSQVRNWSRSPPHRRRRLSDSQTPDLRDQGECSQQQPRPGGSHRQHNRSHEHDRNDRRWEDRHARSPSPRCKDHGTPNRQMPNRVNQGQFKGQKLYRGRGQVDRAYDPRAVPLSADSSYRESTESPSTISGANFQDADKTMAAPQPELEQERRLELPTPDENAQIEERRRLRQAILAKHKDTPRLDDSYSESTSSKSPAAMSESLSLLVGSERVEDGDHNPDRIHVSSALPTFELWSKEDRKASRPSSSTPLREQSGTRHDTGHKSSDVNPPCKDGDDGDSSESEDDMFASKSPVGVKTGATNSKSAKALHMSMLDNWDDSQGYYRVIVGELLDGRYHVQSVLGKGVFSNVVRAYDTVTKRLVAIKIIRNNETMYKAGLKEIDVLTTIKEADPADRRHIIRLERFFDHKAHLCMVFEHLDINLRDILAKYGKYVIHNLKAVRTYAYQIFLALLLLKQVNIIHADIKPDNMLVNEEGNLLKLSDLGSASDASEAEITPYLVSRFYRAPEIMLGLSPTSAIDIWSVGCTLFELYSGQILFTGKSNNGMLKAIMECRGRFPTRMLKKCPLSGMHFDTETVSAAAGWDRFLAKELDPVTGTEMIKVITVPVKPVRDLKQRVFTVSSGGGGAEHVTESGLLAQGAKNPLTMSADTAVLKAATTTAGRNISEHEMRELNHLVDLLDRCLQLNPDKRITPLEALKHPFISKTRV